MACAAHRRVSTPFTLVSQSLLSLRPWSADRRASQIVFVEGGMVGRGGVGRIGGGGGGKIKSTFFPPPVCLRDSTQCSLVAASLVISPPVVRR